MSDTQSGYLVKVEMFIPADPRHPETIVRASTVIADLQAGPPKEVFYVRWFARRKVPASSPATSEGAGTEAAPQPQAVPVADEMPEFLRREKS